MEKGSRARSRRSRKDPDQSDGFVQTLFGAQQWADKMITVVLDFEERFPMLLPVILHKRSGLPSVTQPKSNAEHVADDTHRASSMPVSELVARMVNVVLDFEDEFPGLLQVLLKRSKVPCPDVIVNCQLSWLNPPEMATKIVDVVLDFEDKFPGLLQVLRNKANVSPATNQQVRDDAASMAGSSPDRGPSPSSQTHDSTSQPQRPSNVKQRKRF